MSEIGDFIGELGFVIYMLALLGFFCAVGALSWFLEKVTVVIDFRRSNGE